MIKDMKEKYSYNTIKDFLINFVAANQIFSELSDLNVLESTPNQIVNAIDAEDEIGAIKKILNKLEDQYIITRDSKDKIQIIKLQAPTIKSLEYYKNPDNFKKIRKDMGYTQKEFGFKMGFDSIRRGHTILEKEKGKTPITDRDARLIRYLSVFGDLDQ